MLIKSMMKCGLTLLLFSIVSSSCGYNIITKALDKDQLPSAAQIKELRAANLDIYLCFTLGGPPPVGNLTLVTLPKDSKPNFVYAANCGLLPQQYQLPYPNHFTTMP